MIESLADLLVVSDMDNTLLTAKEGVPSCNRVTIQLFCELGGRFTVATGRPVESVRAALGDLALSCPAITCGGSVLYDMQADKTIEKHFLPRQGATQVIETVMSQFADIGVEIMVEEGKLYIVQANRYTQAHVQEEHMHSVLCPLDQVPDNWAKVVFAADPVTLASLQAFAASLTVEEMYFLHTNLMYFEIMPAGVSKAQALRRLCALQNIPLENTVVIGDYYNDIDLMRAAGHAVAVGNAPTEVKLVADEVVSSCRSGGVGEYLYNLIRRYT